MELVLFKHSIFSFPFIFIAMIVASNGDLDLKLIIFAIVATITARNFAMGMNRLLDKKIDSLNPRTKNRPSVDGRLSKNSILFFIIINAIIFISISFYINNLAFYLSFPILIIIGSYPLFKRFSIFAHIVLGISLGFAPIAGVIAVNSEITLWSLFLSLGVIFWVAGFDLLYSLQDISFDKKHNLYSIPSKYGVKKTLIISKIFHSLTVIFWLLFVIIASLGIFSYLAIFISLIMFIYQHLLVNTNLENINKAFFTINGFIGIIFLIFTILDLVN